jgi:GDP-L-fucose synthase
MQKHSKIFVAGASGMVGSAVVRALQKQGYTNILGSHHSRKPDPSLIPDSYSLEACQLDLMDQQAVRSFYAQHKPDYVVLAAAKVGGIMANNIYRADFIYQNLIMEANVIHAAYEFEVEKLLFLGSSCIYPKLAEQPMREEALLTGPLEPTNEPYAIAKIAGIRMCDAFNRQYGTNFISAMPTNLYGPGDNYDLGTSHVLPALIRKFHLAKCLEQGDWDSIRADLNIRPLNQIDGNASHEAIQNVLKDHGIFSSLTSDLQTLTSVKLWGTGSPLREFLHVDDLASACVFLLENVDYQDIAFTDDTGTVQAHINIGSGQEISIHELAEMVKKVVNFQGEIAWDNDKPDGTPRKLMESGRMGELSWKAKIGLMEGIAGSYDDYCA